MAGRQPDFGATAETVAANVKRLRETKNLSYTQVSERLDQIAGWSINAVGIRRIESGERRVSVDDLIALALALGVSPVTLMMPVVDDPSDKVEVTGGGTVPAYALWGWLIGETWLEHRTGEERAGARAQYFQRETRPLWIPATGAGAVFPLPDGLDVAELDAIARRAAAEAVIQALEIRGDGNG